MQYRRVQSVEILTFLQQVIAMAGFVFCPATIAEKTLKSDKDCDSKIEDTTTDMDDRDMHVSDSDQDLR